MKFSRLTLLCTILLFLIILTSLFAQSPLDRFLPAYTPGDLIVNHFAYTLKYNEQYEQADWVIYYLTADKVKGTILRTDDFRSDSDVKTGSATLADYKGSGYDRGHLAPAADMKWSKTAMSESFYMSNMSPQEPGFNRGIWSTLESFVRNWALVNEEIYIVSGPVLKGTLPTIGKNKVAVPIYFYKVILDYKEPELKGIGFILQNESSKLSLVNYALTIDSVENFTGIDFFPMISDSLENALESSVDLNKWGFAVVIPAPAPDVKSKDLQITVYITKTGTKYHRDGCRYLSKSKIPIPLKEAVLSYGPCSVCNPPTLQTQISKPQIQQENRKSIIVYVTRTGSKYHKAGCRYLSKSSIPIPLEEAKKRYSPCSVCNPPK